MLVFIILLLIAIIINGLTWKAFKVPKVDYDNNVIFGVPSKTIDKPNGGQIKREFRQKENI